jgi:tetratricopeptide (TPR) repeat protein
MMRWISSATDAEAMLRALLDTLLGAEKAKGTAGLPLEAQNYIDNRIRDAVETINARNEAQIRKIEKEKWKFWENAKNYVTVLGWVLAIMMFFFGKEYLRTEAKEAARVQLTTNTIYQAMVEVFRSNVSDFVQTGLRPLNQQIREMESRVTVAVSNAELKQAQLADEQRSIRDQQRVLDLAVKAKGGSLADYEELLSLSGKTNGLSGMAKAAATEVELYFDSYRFRNYVRRVKADPVDMRPIDAPIDEVLFTYLKDASWSQRETAMVEIAAAKRPSTVGYVCEALLKETNLFVIAYGTKALIEIAGIQVGAIDVKSVEKWWATNKDEKKYASPFTPFERIAHYFLVPPWQAQECIDIATPLIEAEPAAIMTRCFRAGCYIRLGKFDLAERDLAEVEKAMPQLRWLFLYRSVLHSAQGRSDDALKDVTRAIGISPTLKFMAQTALPGEIMAQVK